MIFRVATYNIRGSLGLDWRRRPLRILDVLAEISADVVALQEVDHRFGTRGSTIPLDALAARTDYEPARLDGAGGGLGWRGNALLARRAAPLSAGWGLSLPSLEPRGAALADLALPEATVRVLGMHLGLTPSRRVRQSRAILAALAAMPTPRPTVLMGDLNEWRDAGGCLTVFGRVCRLSPPHSSFHAGAPMAALDRIMVTPPLTIVRSGVHRSRAARRASDHLPVWADIAYDPAP